MSVRTAARPRAPRISRRARAPRLRTGSGSFLITGAGVTGGDGDLHEAAMVIAKDAYGRASDWSRSVPASMSVDGDDHMQTITFTAGAAYPAEFRARHPLFGNRRYWYGPPGGPYLAPAADARANDASERYAQIVDEIARENGWTD
jgi:hypothetical protein